MRVLAFVSVILGPLLAATRGSAGGAELQVVRDLQQPPPGQQPGWVFVRAERLAPRAIVDALERGDFYASTGVALSDYQATARGVTITIKNDPYSKYREQFICRN